MAITREQLRKNSLKKLAFKLTPPPLIDSPSFPLPKKWVTQLATLLGVTNQALTKHIGKNSTYTFKKQLIESISIIYWYLNGDLEKKPSDNERTAIIAQCAEDIENCTPGFHNRINLAVASLSKPNNLAELLYSVRENIIYKAATKLTDDVHATNRFTHVAYKHSFGVLPNFDSDVYTGGIEEDDILYVLEKTFKKEYHALKLPFLLCKQAQSLCTPLGYVGKKDSLNPYTYGIYGTIETELRKFLPKLDREKLFIIDEDYNILDINWSYIKQQFYKRLLFKNYIDKTAHTTSLVETALSGELERKDETHIKEALKQYLLNTWLMSNDTIPTNLNITKQYEELVNYLPSYKDVMGSIILKLNLDLLDTIIPDKLKTFLCIILKNTPELFQNLLTSPVLKNKIWSCIFDSEKMFMYELGDICAYLTKHPDRLGIQLASDRLFYFNKINGANNIAFYLSGEDLRNIANQALAFLLKHRKKIGSQLIIDALTQLNTHGQNAFMIASRHQRSTLPKLAALFVSCMETSNIDALLHFTGQLANDHKNICLISLAGLQDASMIKKLFTALHHANTNNISIKNCIAFLKPNFINALNKHHPELIPSYFRTFSSLLELTQNTDVLHSINPLTIVDICPKLVFTHVFLKHNTSHSSNEELQQLARSLLDHYNKKLTQQEATGKEYSNLNHSIFGFRVSRSEKRQAYEALQNSLKYKTVNIQTLIKQHRALRTGQLGVLAKALDKFAFDTNDRPERNPRLAELI